MAVIRGGLQTPAATNLLMDDQRRSTSALCFRWSTAARRSFCGRLFLFGGPSMRRLAME